MPDLSNGLRKWWWQILPSFLWSFVVNNCRLIWQATSPVFFSTKDNGEVEQSLSNIPNDRPVIFVGNHMYMGLDLSLIVYKLLKERGIMIRGLAHPGLFETSFEEDLQVCHLIVFFFHNIHIAGWCAACVIGLNLIRLVQSLLIKSTDYWDHIAFIRSDTCH